MTDSRISKYRDAAVRMRAGYFDVDIPVIPEDEIAHLGRELQELGHVLERRRDEQRLLEELTETVNRGLVLDEVLEHIYKSFHAIIPYDRIGLALLEDEGRVARARWLSSAKPQIRPGQGYTAPMAGSSLQGVIETGQPRILNDLEEHLRKRPDSTSTRLILGEGFRSSLTCPLVTKGGGVGFLFFFSAREHAYDHVHVELFQQIAGQVANVIEKSHLYELLVEAGRDLERRNRFIRQTFGRYISPKIVDQLLDSPGALRMGGDKARVTILMSDLRGFTALSERLPPEQVVRMLNCYLSAMVAVIEPFEGIIDELIGDAILVIFGALHNDGEEVDRAIACAVEMQRAMPELNRKFSRRRWPSLEMGIAIHTGEVVVGNIGSFKRTKYGIVGPPINLTARLESYSVGGQVLITSAVRDCARAPLRLGSAIEIFAKGVSGGSVAFELLGLEEGPCVPGADEAISLYWLDPPRSMGYRFVDGKYVAQQAQDAELVALSTRRAVVIPARPLRMFSELVLAAHGDTADLLDTYVKIIAEHECDDGRRGYVVHFTSMPPAARDRIEALLAPRQAEIEVRPRGAREAGGSI